MYNNYRRYEDRETLERIKRWPNLMYRFKDVRIYSDEHRAYWSGKGNGYTDDPYASDIWTCEEAFKKTRHCGPEKEIQYVEACRKDAEKVEHLKMILRISEEGYAGTLPGGMIVDRREHPEARPIQANSYLGIGEPKEV